MKLLINALEKVLNYRERHAILISEHKGNILSQSANYCNLNSFVQGGLILNDTRSASFLYESARYFNCKKK